nr:MAG TPA: hypothetical protein [Caudoviricetes sp.]
MAILVIASITFAPPFYVFIIAYCVQYVKQNRKINPKKS